MTILIGLAILGLIYIVIRLMPSPRPDISGKPDVSGKNLHVKGTYFYFDSAMTIDVGEKLELRREPRNRHDRNAVAVYGQSGKQIGHISRRSAGRLAPYVDAGQIFYGIVKEWKLSDNGVPAITFKLQGQVEVA
jgi:hypothetical protein